MPVELLQTVQLALGVIFLLSTASKLLNPNHFAHGVAEYQIVPAYLSYPVAAHIIALEGWLAFAHLTGMLLAAALRAGVALLVAFAVAVVINLARGRLLPCYCFGEGGREQISYLTLIRLLCLLVGELLLLFQRYALGSHLLRDNYRLYGLFRLGPALLGTMLLLLGGMWILESTNVFQLLRSIVSPMASVRDGRGLRE